MNRISRLASTFATLTLLCSVGPVSSAGAAPQLGQSAGFTEAFQPDFLSRDVDLMVETLELEDWQRTILESLLADYQNDFRIGVDGLKDKLKAKGEEIKAGDQRNAMGVIMGPIGEWTREKVVLRQRFLDNLRGQLSEAQASRWDALERAMLREKELPRGVLSGESLNLIAIARDVTLSPETAERSKAVLEDYSIALDAALQARASQMAQSQPVIQQAMVEQDWRKGLTQLEAIVARRIALRDIQDRFIDAIATALGTAGADFRERALRSGYPLAYRPSPMIPYFQAARALQGVTPEQISAIDSIEAAYVVAYSDLESRWATEIRAHEPKVQLSEVQIRVAAATGDFVKPDPDPYRRLRDERDRMNEKARADVEALLGEELALQLPGGREKAQELAKRAAKLEEEKGLDEEELKKRAKMHAGSPVTSRRELHRELGKEAPIADPKAQPSSPGVSE